MLKFELYVKNKILSMFSKYIINNNLNINTNNITTLYTIISRLSTYCYTPLLHKYFIVNVNHLTQLKIKFIKKNITIKYHKSLISMFIPVNHKIIVDNFKYDIPYLKKYNNIITITSTDIIDYINIYYSTYMNYISKCIGGK